MLNEALYLHVINELKFKMTKMPKFKVFYRYYYHNAGDFVSFGSKKICLLEVKRHRFTLKDRAQRFHNFRHFRQFSAF